MGDQRDEQLGARLRQAPVPPHRPDFFERLSERIAATDTKRRSPRARPALVAAAALVLVVGLGAAVVAGRSRGTSQRPLADRARPPAASHGRPGPAPDTGSPAAGQVAAAAPRQATSLQPQVAAAQRVVVGRVVELRQEQLPAAGGQGPESPYVVATVAVEESLKPPGAGPARLVVADYDPTSGPPWREGQRLLLFLVPDTSPVARASGRLAVSGGAEGRFAFDGARLQAPFTLDDVRQAAGSQ